MNRKVMYNNANFNHSRMQKGNHFFICKIAADGVMLESVVCRSKLITEVTCVIFAYKPCTFSLERGTSNKNPEERFSCKK